MAIKIPEGITVDRFNDIHNTLQSILTDVNGVAGLTDAEALVIMRLNDSDTAQLVPYHVGWAENKPLEKKREALGFAHPGLKRFGDGIFSDLYKKTVDNGHNADPFVRYTINSPAESANPFKKPKQAVENDKHHITKQLGLEYQLNIGIKVAAVNKCVGTLAIALNKEPKKQEVTDLENVMKDWAHTKLPAFLHPQYELNGLDGS